MIVKIERTPENCPCCNSPAKIYSAAGLGHMGKYIACTKCPIRTRSDMNVDKLIDFWNRRVPTKNTSNLAVSRPCRNFRCINQRNGMCVDDV